MKKFLLLIILFFAISLSAQVTITMEQDGGVYKVPCVVNGAKMKFIFDTGAATVCLSESMAEYLLDNDYITKEDILGTGASQVADGRIVDHVKINLRDIEIAGLHLKDVEAVVVEGQRAPLLLGQTAIQKLGKYTITGNVLYIYSGESDRRTQERRKIYDKLISYNYDLGDFVDFCGLLDSDGDAQQWVYEELTFVDTYPQFEKHKKWLSTLRRFSNTLQKNPNISDAQVLNLFPEFKNAKRLEAARRYSKIEKKYNIHILMEKLPEFFRVDGWWREDDDPNILFSPTYLVDEKADDYEDYMDFFSHVCGTDAYDMEQLCSYYHSYDKSREANDGCRAVDYIKKYYELLWSYQKPAMGDYLNLGTKSYLRSRYHDCIDGLQIAVIYLEKFLSLTNKNSSLEIYEDLGDAYYLLGNCQYALSTWRKWIESNNVDYDDLLAIRNLYGSISQTPYKIFLCMQHSNIHFYTSWKRNFLTYDIIIQLRQRFDEDAYKLLDAGKISPEEAVLKSSLRTKELGERIYYLDQLYYEETGKHNRELLERAVLCGDNDAFEILQGI